MSTVAISSIWHANLACHPSPSNLLLQLVGSFIYKADESPNYPTGYGVSIGMSGLAIVCCIVLKIGYERSNKKKDQLTEEQIESQWTSDAM
jgi:hypothetical protein